jgi:hypothetical protein
VPLDVAPLRRDRRPKPAYLICFDLRNPCCMIRDLLRSEHLFLPLSRIPMRWNHTDLQNH